MVEFVPTRDGRKNGMTERFTGGGRHPIEAPADLSQKNLGKEAESCLIVVLLSRWNATGYQLSTNLLVLAMKIMPPAYGPYRPSHYESSHQIPPSVVSNRKKATDLTVALGRKNDAATRRELLEILADMIVTDPVSSHFPILFNILDRKRRFGRENEGGGVLLGEKRR